MSSAEMIAVLSCDFRSDVWVLIKLALLELYIVLFEAIMPNDDNGGEAIKRHKKEVLSTRDTTFRVFFVVLFFSQQFVSLLFQLYQLSNNSFVFAASILFSAVCL